MKKILFTLLVCLGVVSAQIVYADAVPVSARRQALVAHYLSKNSARITTQEDLLAAAKAGNTAAIAQVADVSLLQGKDKFGNNCFHLAKDAATLQALAGVVRRLAPEKTVEIISVFRNQRNNMGETPLMAHINYGKADTFFLLYRGSELEQSIQLVGSVNFQGAMSTAADVRKSVVVELSKDNSGRTVAQAALANRARPGMEKVVGFFQRHAAYLF